MTLAAFEPHGVPVVSLYLNLTPDQHGRDNYDVFARKAFADQLKRLDENSAERASLERDVERINAYLAVELNRASNGLAMQVFWIVALTGLTLFVWRFAVRRYSAVGN